MSKFPLALSSWGEEELNAINEVIMSDMYSMGPKVAEFEKMFADYLGAKYCVMVNSGSSANLLAIASLFYRKKNKLKRGDEVIVPAVSWPTTYYPLDQYGLKLKFVDIDLETLNFDIDQLAEAITDKTKLIMAVNLLGNSNDYAKIKELTSGRDILLVEDNCESLGAEFESQKTGTFGIMGTYSTFFSHHMSTMEGGVVSTDDEEIYHIMLSMRSHGWTRHLPKENLVTGTKSEDPFEESFKFVLPGYNIRPVEMSGAIGIEQLKKLPGFIEQRRENAKYFFEKMSDVKGIKFQREIGQSSWFGFSMILEKDFPLSRTEFTQFLMEKGIDCRPIVAGNFTKNPVMEHMNCEVVGILKNADLVDQSGLFIGNHHVDMREQIDYLKEVIFDKEINLI